MSTLLDRTVARPPATPAQRLRTTTAAVRVSFTWFGIRKSLSPEQKAVEGVVNLDGATQWMRYIAERCAIRNGPAGRSSLATYQTCRAGFYSTVRCDFGRLHRKDGFRQSGRSLISIQRPYSAIRRAVTQEQPLTVS